LDQKGAEMKDRLSAFYWLNETQFAQASSEQITSQRRSAIEKFEIEGFPSVKDEEWKYTSLKKLITPDYLFPSPFVPLDQEEQIDFNDIKQFLVNDIDCYQVVFINGRYSSWLSETTHTNYDICTLGSAWKKYPEVVESYFNKLTKDDGPLVQLNTGLAWEGLYINVPKNIIVDKPIQVLYISTGDTPVFNQTRSLIILSEGSSAEIIERHHSLTNHETWTNAVDELHVGSNAKIHWVKLQHDSSNASLTQHSKIHQEKDSTAIVHTISTGGKLIRNNLDFSLTGKGAEARMFGLSLGSDRQLVDHHTRVDHIAPNCSSHEAYKGIYDESSRGVFNGKIYVHIDAQKTQAYQQNNNLILSEKATIDTKPQLEIFADDVKCTHGCTIGQLDEDALFYLRARGIRNKEAKALLMLAFANDAIADIQHPSLRVKLSQLIGRKLGVDMSNAL
tara:strand:+ start:11428 stop:12771 length:1344 start_codon:yes stop_codon:yes gene_type:complete